MKIKFVPVLFAFLALLCLGSNLYAQISDEQLPVIEPTSDHDAIQTTAPSASDNSYFAGSRDGKNDAGGNILWGCGGLVCGVVGILGAAVLDSNPDPMMMDDLLRTRGELYASGYASGYTIESRKKNMLYAGAGWLVINLAITVVYVSEVMKLNEYKQKTPSIGFSLPLGNMRPAYSPQP